MSISVQSNIWKSAPYSGEKLLVLLALADFSDDAGRNCFPTMETLAQKARLTVRSAYRIISQLKKDGAITVRSGGGKKHNSYQIGSNYCSTDKKSPLTKSQVTLETKPPTTPNKEEPPLKPITTTRKKKRRSKAEIFAPFSNEVKELVNHFVETWPAVRKGDNSRINIDLSLLASRIENLLVNPSITDSLLRGAARRYLAENKPWLHAPEYFFGPGKNGDDAPWRPYAKMEYHEQHKQLTLAVAAGATQ